LASHDCLGIIHGMRNLCVIVGLVFVAGLAILGQPHSAPAVPYRERYRFEAPRFVDWNTTRLAISELPVGNDWKDTLNWFAAQTDLRLKATVPTPNASFTFNAPANSHYTLTDIYDILNEVLQTQHKYTLVRGENLLTLVDADAELPDHLVPRLRMADLKDRGRTEIVEVVIKLRAGLLDEETALDLKRAVGPGARVTPLDGNRVIVRGTVSALRRMLSGCED
jgi:hypothetical protein